MNRQNHTHNQQYYNQLEDNAFDHQRKSSWTSEKRAILENEKHNNREYNRQDLLSREHKTQTKHKNEDPYRAYLASDLAEQKTVQKKPSTLLKDSSENLSSQDERIQKLKAMLSPNSRYEGFTGRVAGGYGKHHEQAATEASNHNSQRSFERRSEYQSNKAKSRGSFEYEEDEVASFENYPRAGQKNGTWRGQEKNDRHFGRSERDDRREYAQELFEDVNSKLDRLSAIDRGLEEKNQRSPQSYNKNKQPKIKRGEFEIEDRSSTKLQDADYIKYIASLNYNNAKGKQAELRLSPKREQLTYSEIRYYEQEAKPRVSKWNNSQPSHEHKSSGTKHSYQEEYRGLPKTPDNNKKYDVDYSSIFNHGARHQPIKNNFVQTFGSEDGHEHESEDPQEEEFEDGDQCEEDDQAESEERYEQEDSNENQTEEQEFEDENENIEDHYAFDPDEGIDNEQYEQIRYYSKKKVQQEEEQDSEGERQIQQKYHHKVQGHQKQQSNSSIEEAQPALTYFQIHGRTPKKTQEFKIPEAKSASSMNVTERGESSSKPQPASGSLNKSQASTISDNINKVVEKEPISSRTTKSSGFFDPKQIPVADQNEITSPVENHNKHNIASSNHKKITSGQDSANNSLIHSTSQGNLNPSQNPSSQPLKNSSFQLHQQSANSFQQMTTLHSPNVSVLHHSGYYPNPEVPNQQNFFQQTFGQAPYTQAFPQLLGQGMNNATNPQFMMPSMMNYPYQVPGNANFYPGFVNPHSMQPYAMYPQETFNKWQSQTTSHSNQEIKSEPSKQTNKSEKSESIETKFEEAEEGIKDYLKDQEEFLRKLDEEKKQRREKIEREKLRSEEQMRPKENKYSEPGKTESKKEPINLSEVVQKDSPAEKNKKGLIQLKDDLWKGANAKESPAERPKKQETDKSDQNSYKDSPKQTNTKTQSDKVLQERNSPEESKRLLIDPAIEKSNKWKNDSRPSSQLQKSPLMRDKQSKDDEVLPKKGEIKQAQDQKQALKREVFEIVWDQPDEAEDKIQKRKKSLADRLDNNKPPKREKGAEKTKEELFLLRKQMLEYKGPNTNREKSANREKSEDRSFTKGTPGNGSNDNIDADLRRKSNPFVIDATDYKRKKSREPNSALLERLAGGIKTKVSKDEMVKFSNQRYEQLPEIQKKKDADKKKEELRNRKEKVKELEQKIRESNQRNINHPHFQY